MTRKVLTRLQGGQEAIDDAKRDEQDELNRRERLRKEEEAMQESIRKTKEVP